MMVDKRFKRDHFKVENEINTSHLTERTYTEREFQNVGLAMENARSPRTVLDLGMTRQRQSDDLIE